ncbi:DUF86 domain-containing protein [Alteribacter keqinensis]|uniref:DUF86 domain-containing protein n=1 Tax=Alteribacter keqinensis TaxID=2483800 RepID=A0A3M7TN64_9BACI|nr:DUF86 domain-containing protein [Alteribacter keqinensis]
MFISNVKVLVLSCHAHRIRRKLGLPQTSRDAFSILEKEGMLEPSLNKLMKAMVGFRNIAVHDYQELNLIILQRILENHLQDFQRYTESILKADAGE